jgi:ubiquinone/menaquinone biosynthesis C-methylase UbiE
MERFAMQPVPDSATEEIIWGPVALENRREQTQRLLSSVAPVREKWMHRNRYYYGRIQRLLGFLVEPGKTVLSVRCGLGHQLADLKPSAGVGLDISPEIVEIARTKHPSCAFVTGFPDAVDFETHFAPRQKFDYIIFNAIGDTPDVQAALHNLQKVADAHTRLIILTYNHLWEPLFALAEKCGLKVPSVDQNWLSEGDIVNFLEVTDFEWLKTFRITLFPKYVPILSEVLNDFCARLPGVNHLCMVQAIVARRAPEPVAPSTLKVSVVIPCKDERGNIESAVMRIPKLGAHTELLFCDDKSTDGTAEEVLRMQNLHLGKDIRLIAGPGICKAQNVWAGFEEATGDVLMILDADLTTMPEELPYFLELLASRRAEFVNGSRLVYPMPRAAMKPTNMLGNKFFSVAFSYLLGQRVKDTLCGTKVLWKRDWERLKPLLGSWGTNDRWGDYELLFGAAKLNLRIRDLPVHYQERLYGSTKMTKVFLNGLVMLRMCFFGFLKLKLGY